jgi:hypothetical protein
MNQEEFLKSEMFSDFMELAHKYKGKVSLAVFTNDKGKCEASFTIWSKEEVEDFSNKRMLALQLKEEGKTNAEIVSTLFPEDEPLDNESVEWINSLRQKG